MSLKFYDPDRVVIYLAGIRVQGFADGEFLTYKRQSPGFAIVVGTDGEVARSKSNNKTIEIVIKLLQTSASNLALSALHNTDLNAINGAGVGTLLIQDTSGNTLIQSPQAWIVQSPDGSMDRTAKAREWTIMTGNETVLNEGGN